MKNRKRGCGGAFGRNDVLRGNNLQFKSTTGRRQVCPKRQFSELSCRAPAEDERQGLAR